jgi:hypothetical protein
MATEYRCTYHKLLDEVAKPEIFSEVAEKLFEVLLATRAPLHLGDLLHLVFEGELEEPLESFSRQERKDSIKEAMQELWRHAIPVVSYRKGYYVLGDNPYLVSCEMDRLEEEIETLQERLASMRNCFEEQVCYGRRRR